MNQSMVTWLTVMVAFAWAVSVVARVIKPELSFPALDGLMTTTISAYFGMHAIKEKNK